MLPLEGQFLELCKVLGLGVKVARMLVEHSTAS
jgi:hypothetical protein